MRIITISREFGSGGREVGKRLADYLGMAYYDKEIVTAIAQKNELDEAYVERALDQQLYKSIPLTFGRTFTYVPSVPHNTLNLLVDQNKLIRGLASHGDCIVVGRNSDILLEEYNPLKLFIYADMDSKVKRCKARASSDEKLTERELIKQIKEVDKARADSRAMLSNIKWGDKTGYHLCVNTTDLDIKSLIPILGSYAEFWFQSKEYR